MKCNIVLAPHLDDEVIGCYSVLETISDVIYFSNDYRRFIPKVVGINYTHIDDCDMTYMLLNQERLIYAPCSYDYHPLHRHVNKYARLTIPFQQLRYYSIEMNHPQLEEEDDPHGKKRLLESIYRTENMTQDAKYYLFRSIKEYDII
jgi:LmbE family N-acetylglucosaminyl deacetylase